MERARERVYEFVALRLREQSAWANAQWPATINPNGREILGSVVKMYSILTRAQLLL